MTIAAAAAVATMTITSTPAGGAETAFVDNLVWIPGQGGDCSAGGPLIIQTLDSGQCKTDNASVSVYRDAVDPYKLESDDREVTEAAMRGECSPTDLAISIVSTYVGSGTSETDIVFQEGQVGNGPGGTIGYTWCNDANNLSSYECDQMFVRLEAAYLDYALTCHEAGHAIGLAHGDDSESGTPGNSDPFWGCMRTPWNSLHMDLGENQRNNINKEWNQP